MPRLLIIDSDRSVVEMLERVLSASDMQVLAAETGREGLELAERCHPDAILLEIKLPDMSGFDLFRQMADQDWAAPVIFTTGNDSSDLAIEAIKIGGFDYLLKPLDFRQLQSLVTRASQISAISRRASLSPPPAPEETSLLIGNCAAMQEVYKAIGRVATQGVTVLIHGESGTGKELVARAIWQHSDRAGGKFLAVNCAAIPETLLESELFGHERGSFTGAESRRIGKFEQCHGGTLFLDEIGDMTPLVQSKVLRVLQEQKFERVGGCETIETNVRIIAASNRDLESMVGQGEFRADLYYRLNGFGIHLPPLRQRVDDIFLLLDHYLARFNAELGKEVIDVSTTALDLLMSYSWPGNVREFQSVLKQALLQAQGPVLLPEFLPAQLREPASLPATAPGPVTVVSELERFIDRRLDERSTQLYAEVLAHIEQVAITRVLRHTCANQSMAAKILGITRGSLRNKIRTHGIRIDQVVNLSDRTPGGPPRNLQQAG